MTKRSAADKNEEESNSSGTKLKGSQFLTAISRPGKCVGHLEIEEPTLARSAKKHVLRDSQFLDVELRKAAEYKGELDFEEVSRGQG